MASRVLHVLAQRPGRTGSGTTLDAIVREAARRGWDQHAIVGTPRDDPSPAVAELEPERVWPLCFETDELPFPVPGMSDVMPYRSSRFRDLSADQLARYRSAWQRHVASVMARVRPDVVHAHHVFLVSGILARIAPPVPSVVHVHSTGLRQMQGCPHLADEVRGGCARHARFLVLHEGQVPEVVASLGVSRDRVVVVGAGYREDVFHAGGRSQAAGRPARSRRILFVGKLSAAKGLPWLLEAFAELAKHDPTLELDVVGDGHGPEADALRAKMAAMAPGVIVHGAMAPEALAARMRASDVCVLPSFQEGLPLVLVEAAASGCRIVATALQPVTRELAPRLGPAVVTVPLPRLLAPDRPAMADASAFVAALAAALRTAVDEGPALVPPAALADFTWNAVFARVESVWRELRDARG